MELPNPAPPDNPLVNSYVASHSTVNNQPVSIYTKKLYFVMAAVLVVVVAVTVGLFWVSKKPKTLNNIQTDLNEHQALGFSTNSGVQVIGGVGGTESGKLSSTKSRNQNQERSATIYEVKSEGIEFLVDSQLLFFPYNKMTLYTKIENLKKGQAVRLVIAYEAEVDGVKSVQVQRN